MAHPADVILEAWGPDLASCYEEAAAALVGTFVAEPGAEVVAERRLHLDPAPDDSLLIDVLDEVIFILDTVEDVPVSVSIRQAGDGGLDLVASLADRQQIGEAGAVPKAVSRSGLRVDRQPDRVSCRFLVDV